MLSFVSDKIIKRFIKGVLFRMVMVNINVAEFARKIEEYHSKPNRPEEWFHPVGTLMLNDKSVESTLCIPVERELTYDSHASSFVEAQGIRFGYNTKLVMRLIA